MKMEFNSVNYLDTSTMISVDTGTDTASYLFDRNSKRQYQSSGKNADGTAATITINFPYTITIDKIVMQNHNLKGFSIYYNETTTNSIAILNADTSTISYSSNSSTNQYFYFSATAMTSLTIVPTSTMVANEEKKIGELWLMKQTYQLEYNPDSAKYKPNLNRKEYDHEMADGGTSLYVLDTKFETTIDLSFISNTERSSLYDLYSSWNEFVFIPFPTGTSWDNRIYEVNWIGDFGFDRYTENYLGAGYSGQIKLKETPV